ncbi:MAG TPA: hypothetical protein VI488_16075 [Candidatus Angelobacter sp.]
MLNLKTILVFLLAAGLSAAGQAGKQQPKAPQKDSSQPGVPAEDISGMYSFLGEGEFLEISRDEDGITGYVSRMGDMESDRGAFLDQFFSKASVQGHDVSFTTKVVHGVWFEFKGQFERGPGKSKAEDGYFVLRGTLTEFTASEDKSSSTSRSRQVEFKWLAQPQGLEESKGPPKKK